MLAQTSGPTCWKPAALNSCTEIWVSLIIASGKQRQQIMLMSALECPCWRKGGGVTLTPRAGFTVSLDIGWSGNSWRRMGALPTGMLMQLVKPQQLLHAVPQHLIGCDEHDTNDERHGKRTDEALPHTCLTVLFRWVNWKTKKKNPSSWCHQVSDSMLRFVWQFLGRGKFYCHDRYHFKKSKSIVTS